MLAAAFAGMRAGTLRAIPPTMKTMSRQMRQALEDGAANDGTRFAGGAGYVSARSNVIEALSRAGLIDSRNVITATGRAAVSS